MEVIRDLLVDVGLLNGDGSDVLGLFDDGLCRCDLFGIPLGGDAAHKEARVVALEGEEPRDAPRERVEPGGVEQVARRVARERHLERAAPLAADLALRDEELLGEQRHHELLVRKLQQVDPERAREHGPHAPAERDARGHDGHQFARAVHLREGEAHGAHGEQSRHELEELERARAVELEQHPRERGPTPRGLAALHHRVGGRHVDVELQDDVDRGREHEEQREQQREVREEARDDGSVEDAHGSLRPRCGRRASMRARARPRARGRRPRGWRTRPSTSRSPSSGGRWRS